MTPQERAEKITEDYWSKIGHWTHIKARLSEAIRVAIVEHSNEELERRREAEKRYQNLRNMLDRMLSTIELPKVIAAMKVKKG